MLYIICVIYKKKKNKQTKHLCFILCTNFNDDNNIQENPIMADTCLPRNDRTCRK